MSKFCYNCGNELDEKAYVCVKCGVLVAEDKVDNNVNNNVDKGSFGWAVLGFFVPLVGLILFLVWRSDRPLSSKKAGIGALVSVIVNFIVFVLAFFLILGVSFFDEIDDSSYDFYDYYDNYDYKFE